MEDSEIRWLKEEVVQIKETVKDVAEVVNDMRVLVAGNYVTKHDFEEFKRVEKSSRRWLAGYLITVVGVFTALLNIWLNK